MPLTPRDIAKLTGKATTDDERQAIIDALKESGKQSTDAERTSKALMKQTGKATTDAERQAIRKLGDSMSLTVGKCRNGY